MKRFLLSLIVMASFYFSASAQGNLCSQATSIMAGNLNNYPAGVNSGTAETGANYGCLGSEPNPAWYYLHIATSGTIEINMFSTPQHDIDFACWGPFTDPVSPCVAQLTAGSPSPPTHAVAGPSVDYPSMNLIDCSYSTSWNEWCYLPNAQAGEYYLLMITNYSNQPCDITFSQTAGTGSLHYASYVSGIVFNDLNGNGVKDPGEDTLVGKKVKMISTNAVHLTQNNGYYYFASDSGTQQIQCLPSNYWDFTTDSIITFYVPDTAIQIGNIDFGERIQAASSDILIDITGNAARANTDVTYWLTYKNIAALPKNGSIELTIDTLTTFVSSIPPPDTQNGNILTWYYANLLSLQTRQIAFKLHMPDVISIGDTITTTAIINPVAGDMDPLNNYDTLNQIIVGSFDPNDKIVDKGVGVQGLTLFGSELEYTIRFQNTGTYPASQVKITDAIDPNLDMESFCLVSSSHNVTVEIDSGVVTFLFENIQLPDSGSDLSASSGFVKFSIRPKSMLAEYTPVLNQANIYFDSNPAVPTNQTLNTFISKMPTTGIGSNDANDKMISIYPNPSTGFINIIFNEPTKDTKVDVLNSIGKVILSKEIRNQTFSALDLSNFAKGIYLIKVQNGNGVVVKKLIVE